MDSRRIAIVAHGLRVGGGLSVGQNLIASVLRQGRQHEFFCVVPEGLGYDEICGDQPHCDAIYYRRCGGHFGRWYFDECELPRLVARFCPDVVLALGNRGLSGARAPQAILCQDAHLFYPREHFGIETPLIRLMIALNRHRIRRDLSHTQLVFCQTPVAANRFRTTYGYAGLIRVAPNAVSRTTVAGEAQVAMPRVLSKCQPATKLLCLTRYYAHKNLEAIIEMFDRYRDDLRDVVVVLTISEADHPNAGALLKSIQRRRLGNHIVNVGLIPQGELAAYYRHCEALFLPTLLESFSGTYLEAMRFGCPILTSDMDFAHYVCGDAALYFDPRSLESMKNAILKIKHDHDMARQLVANATARLKIMYASWDDVAKSILGELLAVCTPRVVAKL